MRNIFTIFVMLINSICNGSDLFSFKIKPNGWGSPLSLTDCVDKHPNLMALFIMTPKDKRQIGVYVIENIVNNKIYVGSSIDIKGRLNRHFYDLRKNKHPNHKLQRAFNKYGEHNFTHRILEVYADSINLIPSEQFYIDLFEPFYNCMKTAGTPGTFTLHNPITEEKREKMRKAHLGVKLSEKHRLSIVKSLIGHNRHPGHKNRLGAKLKPEELAKRTATRRSNGNYGWTSEQRKKMCKIIWQYDLNGTFIKEWPSIEEAQISLGMTGIWDVCAGRCESRKGFIFKYKEVRE